MKTIESKIRIFGHEYNEYVIGYVIKTDKGDVNAQFNKVYSNHPEPAYSLQLGCEGDNTADHLTDDDCDYISDYIRKNSEMDELENAFTKAMHNGSGFEKKCSPIYEWEIEEAAEFEED